MLITPFTDFDCPKCQIGTCVSTRLPYFQMVLNQSSVLAVLRMLAYQCDVCGYVEYDDEALDQLSLLLAFDGDRALPPSNTDGLSAPLTYENQNTIKVDKGQRR